MSDLNHCLQMLKHKLQDTEITIENIMTVVKFSIEVVEITELKGEEQKNMAICLVRTLVIEAPISDEKEKLLLDIIDQGVLGNTVDLVIDASKGNLKINKIVKIASGCCAAFYK